jgi:hypothetical protein
MRHLKLLLVSLCVGALSQALAADPPPPSPPVASATPVSSVPPAASTAATSADKPEDPTAARLEAEKKRFEAQKKRLKAAGYKPEVHNGVTLFCRNEQKMGTRFETPFCGEGDDIERAARDAKDVMQKGQMQNPLRSQ